ncbi:SCO family protein [Deinococcus maricopensis]|uniref:Electron transport protein SCO1/SenC n=1 Tax=Deinococcus maricopensis (strain DSM 21211 / LMG 22137 / NRRL B-23946 / LB-34) TaxID=709986 RepID=E8U6C7_DEIML|nr:SCO family protein [Deinococcus maricopensis]ADV66616.1 electron transport protein SCO1/SenC [Deinococcus maricopensis DSM 21211]
MKWLTWMLVAVAVVLGGVLAYRQFAPQPLRAGTALDARPAVPAVSVLTEDGRAARFTDGAGRVRLVFFGYTHCPDICPITLGVLAGAYKTLTPAQRAQLRVDFVSVDPLVDRPDVVRAYLGKFNPDFRGFTGTSANMVALQKAFFVYARSDAPPAASEHAAHMSHMAGMAKSEAEASGPATLVHSDQVAVVSRDGHFVRVYDGLAVTQGELARDLPALLRTY